VAAFRANTSNLQVRSLVGGVLTDSNAGKERVTGVELEASLHPTGALTLGANYSYLDAIYVAFQGCAAGGIDCSGNTVPFTPKHDLTLFGDYTAELAGRGSLTFHVDDKIADKYQLVATNTQQIAVPYTARKNVLNASLTYGAPSGAWDIRLWSNNLLNKTYIGNALAYNFYLVSPAEASAAGGIGKTDAERISVAPPRSVGVTLTYRFN
jgi:iron complex outermembrane receptor protein